MASCPTLPPDAPPRLPRIPRWVSSRPGTSPEDVAFRSGAALAILHPFVAGTSGDVPQRLLRDRLALQAAEACMALTGRPERAAELRDAVHLLRPGEAPGPAGEVFVLWRRAVRETVQGRGLARAMPAALAGRVPDWLKSPSAPGPVARAAEVLERVLAEVPREEATALVLADTALARALGWPHPVPLLAAGLGRRDLRAGGAALRLACHGAVASSAGGAVRLASDLARRADRLRAVAPVLRAKGAGAALRLLLRTDALQPSGMLSPMIRGTTVRMSDRAARRLCERLVELGAVRELTGRASFRLYGL